MSIQNGPPTYQIMADIPKKKTGSKQYLTEQLRPADLKISEVYALMKTNN